MIFISDGTGIAFLLLGPFIILGGFRRGVDRRRLAYSGLGSVVVGIGNILLPRYTLFGLLVVAIGIWLVIKSARIQSDSW